MLAVPLPGAELFERATEEKKILKNIVNQYIKEKLGEYFRDKWPVYTPDGITLEQMNKLRKRGYKAFYFTPYYIKRRIKKDIKSRELLKRDIIEALSIVALEKLRASFC